MRKFWMIVVLGCLFAVPSMKAEAAEVDVLLEKLVEKGVLTPLEAQIVKDDTKEDVARQISLGRMDTMPSWIQTMKLKGDLRLRYQTESKESQDHWRNRGRYRLRVGVEAQPGQDLSVGFGLASGNSNDSKSTNQTFDNNFSKDAVWIDYAYAEYRLMPELKIVGGKFKMKDYLWTTTDLLWDGDINPEGASLNYKYSLMENTDVFLNAGSWLIKEINSPSSSVTDPFMHYFQGGVAVKEGKMDAKLAGVYYGFNGIQGQVMTHKTGTNTGSNTGLVYDYDAVGASAQFGVKKLLGGLPFGIDDRIALFGDYVKNVSSGVAEDAGWAVGMSFGHSRVRESGQWQAKYVYASLEKDAWLDCYPDSDRYGGKTNIKGHEVILTYGLMKNVTLGLDYYRSDVKNGTSDREQIVQADIGIKF